MPRPEVLRVGLGLDGVGLDHRHQAGPYLVRTAGSTARGDQTLHLKLETEDVLAPDTVAQVHLQLKAALLGHLAVDVLVQAVQRALAGVVRSPCR